MIVAGQGRHRAGSPYQSVRPRLWDERERAWATHLDHSAPNWSIIYGVWSRLYFAFAAWPVERALVVDAPTPERLWAAMQEAEMPWAATGGK
ncbi:hypothetical protein AB0K60_07320 [Thermopolyspora sp. NPDC052614]|uniref:hypothetical protein n=1 Tax=Thermopolyspora sp. NPDC052614 TaxID=3155682 RepID=UPI003438CA25